MVLLIYILAVVFGIDVIFELIYGVLGAALNQTINAFSHVYTIIQDIVKGESSG